MRLNKKYTIAWILWVLAFGVIEYKAIADKSEGDTLSEHWRKLVGTGKDGQRNVLNWVFRAGTVGLLAWLLPHILTGAV